MIRLFLGVILFLYSSTTLYAVGKTGSTVNLSWQQCRLALERRGLNETVIHPNESERDFLIRLGFKPVGETSMLYMGSIVVNLEIRSLPKFLALRRKLPRQADFLEKLRDGRVQDTSVPGLFRDENLRSHPGYVNYEVLGDTEYWDFYSSVDDSDREDRLRSRARNSQIIGGFLRELSGREDETYPLVASTYKPKPGIDLDSLVVQVDESEFYIGSYERVDTRFLDKDLYETPGVNDRPSDIALNPVTTIRKRIEDGTVRVVGRNATVINYRGRKYALFDFHSQWIVIEDLETGNTLDLPRQGNTVPLYLNSASLPLGPRGEWGDLSISMRDILSVFPFIADDLKDRKVEIKSSDLPQPKKEFEIAQTVPTKDLIRTTHIQGTSIERIEERLRGMHNSDRGTLPKYTSLRDVLADDNTIVTEKYGLTHQRLAEPFFNIRDQWVKKDKPQSAIFVYEGIRYEWKITGYLGYMWSSFDHLVTDYDCELKNLETGKVLKFSGLLPDFISRYGFYQAASFEGLMRLEPETIIRFFGIKK